MFVQNFNNNIIIVNSGGEGVTPRPLQPAATTNLQPQLVSLRSIPQPLAYFNNNTNLSEQQQEELPRRTDKDNNFASYSVETSENHDPTSYRADKLCPDHVECLCKALENSCDVDRLASFLENFSTDLMNHPCREQLLRAKALVLFQEQKFEDFYQLVRSNHFSSDNHPFLQHLWNEAHYTETEIMRGKKLDPVSRYRVRKKNNFPRTIWDGEGTSYCFKKSSRAILKEAYRKHQTPSQHYKQELAKATKLSVIQVSNWFKNQRQRARQNRRNCRSSSSSLHYYSSEDGGADSEQEEEEDSHSDTVPQYFQHQKAKLNNKKVKPNKSRKSGEGSLEDTGLVTFHASEVDTEVDSEASAAAAAYAQSYSAAAAGLRMYYAGEGQPPVPTQPFFYPQQQMTTQNYHQQAIPFAMNLLSAANPANTNNSSIFAVQNAVNEVPLKYQSL